VAHPVDPTSRREFGPALPEHCVVEGRLRLEPGDGTLSAAELEVRLPSRWSGRFFHQGSFDLQPRSVVAFGRTSGAGGLEANALAQGYAVLSSNAGRRQGATAGAAPGEAALPRAAAAAKAFVEAYYGRPADRSYFAGCSEGGREGLLFAQQWPDTFDGIVAVAPLLRESDAALAAAWTLRQFNAVAPQARPGQRVLSRAFSVEELFVVAGAILKQCDALDGAEDGFVMDMAGCRFDPGALQCPRRGAKSCLPKAKAQALAEALRGPRDATGAALYAAWPWDPGVAAPGWRAWTLGSAGPGAAPNPGLLTLVASLPGRDPPARPSARAGGQPIDIGRDAALLRARRDAEGAFREAPLEDFRRRGGRLLLVHGAADPVVSAWVTVDYQRHLDRARSEGGAQGAADHARTFIVPGMNHCAGGPALDRFDALAALVEWVEAERPPERIEARGSAVLGDETRPLCPWPQVARYRGTGSVHDSASHDCR
jgi:feruloyl esterase